MTKVQTYCTTWKASVGSTMMEYAHRDSLPDLYVDYHEYKALEAENARLRAECDRLKKALEEIRYTSIHYTQDGDEVQHIVDAALAQQEGGET